MEKTLIDRHEILWNNVKRTCRCSAQSWNLPGVQKVALGVLQYMQGEGLRSVQVLYGSQPALRQSVDRFQAAVYQNNPALLQVRANAVLSEIRNLRESLAESPEANRYREELKRRAP